LLINGQEYGRLIAVNKTNNIHKIGFFGTSKVQVSGRIQLSKELLQTLGVKAQQEFDIFWNPENDDVILRIRKQIED